MTALLDDAPSLFPPEVYAGVRRSAICATIDRAEYKAFFHRQEMEDCRAYLAGATVLSTGGDGQTTYRRAVPTGPDPGIADARSRGWGVELLERASLKRLEAYHAAMTAKYERAARYPWLPVESDPPEPE
jgi:hypothetical protein